VRKTKDPITEPTIAPTLALSAFLQKSLVATATASSTTSKIRLAKPAVSISSANNHIPDSVAISIMHATSLLIVMNSDIVFDGLVNFDMNFVSAPTLGPVYRLNCRSGPDETEIGADTFTLYVGSNEC
jgi:hypothetical protein